MKYEWKKEEKNFYFPSEKPTLITIPKNKYIFIKGKGNPNSKQFKEKVSLLYNISYAIKMMPKKGFTPSNYFEYSVYPLEGLWNISEKEKTNLKLNKDELLYTIMIKQPNFVNDTVFKKAVEIVSKKNKTPLLNEVYLDEIEDGLSVQILHIGSYDDELLSFNKMKTFIDENKLEIKTLIHREIYLSNPSKVDCTKLKTVLRYFVKKQ